MSKWKDEYSVKIHQLDGQHKEFFGILDELSMASREGDLLDIDFVMAKLDVYALYHFTCEEHYMAKYGFPDFDRHRKEHLAFQFHRRRWIRYRETGGKFGGVPGQNR